jgi:hypothetical protein
MSKRPSDGRPEDPQHARQTRPRTESSCLQGQKRTGRWSGATAVPLGGEPGTFKVRFSDHTEKRDDAGAILPVARSELRRVSIRPPPGAEQTLRAAGVRDLPSFFPTQNAMFQAAQGAGHSFYGAFQKPKLVWTWDEGTTGVTEEDGHFTEAGVYEYFSCPTVAAFEDFYALVPSEKKRFLALPRRRRQF